VRAWAAVVLVAWAGEARADLMADADELVAAWRRQGAVATRAATVFLGEGEQRSVPLPAALSGDALCVRVAALGERSIRFVAAVEGGEAVQSASGAVVLEGCGDERPRELRLGMVSPRGAIEVVVTSHDGPLYSLEDVLLGRAEGALGPPDELVGGLVPPPFAARVEGVQKSARRDGASMIVPVTAPARQRGSGSVGLRLPEGCHRLTILADSDAAVDVDAEVWLPEAQSALRRDHSHAPDARLDFCLGDEAQVELRFGGAAGGAATIVDALWPLPAGIPSGFGPAVRAGMAWALFRRRAPAVADAPETVLLGGASSTLVPLSLVPGACYLAALGRMDGEADGARVTVTVAGEVHHDEAEEEPLGAAVSFCAGPSSTGTLQVDLRSTSAWWALGLWRVGSTE
jgi:hypothetical protein